MSDWRGDTRAIGCGTGWYGFGPRPRRGTEYAAPRPPAEQPPAPSLLDRMRSGKHGLPISKIEFSRPQHLGEVAGRHRCLRDCPSGWHVHTAPPIER